jgi:hypothetical protein
MELCRSGGSPSLNAWMRAGLIPQQPPTSWAPWATSWVAAFSAQARPARQRHQPAVESPTRQRPGQSPQEEPARHRRIDRIPPRRRPFAPRAPSSRGATPAGHSTQRSKPKDPQPRVRIDVWHPQSLSRAIHPVSARQLRHSHRNSWPCCPPLSASPRSNAAASLRRRARPAPTRHWLSPRHGHLPHAGTGTTRPGRRDQGGASDP